MKGVARADGQQMADYEAVVLALSHLSQAVVSDRTPSETMSAAAETGAVLLQVDSAAVFLSDSSKGLNLAAGYQYEPAKKKTPIPGEAALRQCLEDATPVLVSSVASDKRKGMSLLARQGVESLLCVPLKADGGAIGVLMVLSNRVRTFSPSDIEVLSAIALQVTFAVSRSKPTNALPESGTNSISRTDAELIELANRKLQELSIVNRVSEAVASILDLSQLLDLALDQCLIAVGANVGSIMLLDEDTSRLRIRASKGICQDIIDTASVAVGEGISGWVAEHGQPILVHDARQDPRFKMNRYRDDISSAMSVPLKVSGRVTGVLNASTIEQGRRFGPREVEFLSTIANQVAVAIDKAQLYDRLNRRSIELASLLQISEAITSTLELSEVLSLITARFMAMAHMDACALLAYEADAGRFRRLDGQGLKMHHRKSSYLELALPIAGMALDAREPVWTELGADSPLRTDISDAEGFVSAICVPLVSSGRMVGAIALFSTVRRVPSKTELRTLASLGGLAGVALHNALIYKHKYDIARSLQFQLVPTVPLTAEGLDIGHRFLPAREVGGDYYDLIKIGSGRVGVVIADVAGNSVSAAMYTSMGKHVLRAYAVDDHPPGVVLERLNRVVCDETQPEVFITIFYGVFDANTRVFRYACAGHEPPLLSRADGTIERLWADGILAGIRKDVVFEEKEVVLDPGSVLVLFTDGVVDSPAVRGRFTVEDIAELVASSRLKPAQETADNIYAGLMKSAGTGPQDDVALVVLKSV